MKNPTEELAQYIREKGIRISAIIKATGLNDNALYASLGDRSRERWARELRADEFLAVCAFIGVNPMDFYNHDSGPDPRTG